MPFKGNWLNLKLKRNPVSSSSLSFIIILTVEVDSFFLCLRISNDCRDLKLDRRQRRQGQRQNSNSSKTTSWKAGRDTFSVHFFPIPARLRRESSESEAIRFMCVTMCTAFIYQNSYWQQIRQSQIYCVLDSCFFDSLTTDLHLIQRIQTKQKRLLKKDRFTKTGS